MGICLLTRRRILRMRSIKGDGGGYEMQYLRIWVVIDLLPADASTSYLFETAVQVFLIARTFYFICSHDVHSLL